MGKAGILPEETDFRMAKMAEKKLQEQCEAWLRLHNLFYLRMPMHKPTSIRIGWPDFAVFFPGNHALLIEIKVEGGRLSEDQQILHGEYATKTGDTVHLVVCLDQFIKVVGDALHRWAPNQSVVVK